jgi:hypothetical protein
MRGRGPLSRQKKTAAIPVVTGTAAVISAAVAVAERRYGRVDRSRSPRPERSARRGRAAWSAVHGLAALGDKGPFRTLPPREAEEAQAAVLAMIAHGIGKNGATARLPPDPAC